MSLREQLMNGETICPDDEHTKSAVTSVVSQLRSQGVEIETLGGYRYRVLQSENGNGHENGSQKPRRRKRPPLPGEHLVLDLTVTELKLDGETLMVSASDGVHDWEFAW